MNGMRIRGIFAEALRLRQAGDLPAALRTVRPLLKITPRKAHHAAIIATLFFESKRRPQAAHWFGATAALNPKSEHASLGLFHSLWATGKHQKAFNEMRRFLETSDSREFSRLLRDLQSELGLARRPRAKAASPASATDTHSKTARKSGVRRYTVRGTNLR